MKHQAANYSSLTQRPTHHTLTPPQLIDASQVRTKYSSSVMPYYLFLLTLNLPPSNFFTLFASLWHVVVVAVLLLIARLTLKCKFIFTSSKSHKSEFNNTNFITDIFNLMLKYL